MSQRWRRRRGRSGFPGSGLLRTPPQLFTPPQPGKPRAVVIIDRPHANLDPIALALLAAGDAVRVSPGGPARLGAVRHADGRQLQRVGIQPHVRVSPTIAGLCAGRDEVLERGGEVLRERIRVR